MAASAANGNDGHRPARVLVTDDDPRLLESLGRLLRHYDYHVDTAAGGAEAIQRLSSEAYDLLVLDLRMPQVSGHDVLRYLADSGIGTMTIVVSGESSIDDVSRALRAGAYDYIKKPYVPDELLATIRNAIRKKQLEDSHRVMRSRLDVSERLHRFIVNSSPDLIYILDELGNFSFLNAKIEELLGYSPAELLGKPFSSIVDPRDREKARYFFEQAWRHEDDVRTLDMVLQPRAGGPAKRYFEVSLWPVREADGLDGAAECYRTYGTARDVTERMEAEAFINFQAYHDLLTRLPNRALFKDRLGMAISHAARQALKPAVMFIDLDRFKLVNDTLGHTLGDRLLQAVAQRLQDCLRKSDTLSRFGGDEFTLLLPDAGERAVVAQVANKLLDAVGEPFLIDGQELCVGASIGIAVYPEAGDSMDELIKNADIAMYRVKNSGKNGYQFYSPEMSVDPARDLRLEQELRRALEHDQFEIHYQPQVCVHSGQVLGVEALVRWRHPELGMIAPDAFIPVAEDSRLILELDRRTLQRACRDIRQLSAYYGRRLRLAVNLSPRLVERDNFVELVLEILEREQLPAEVLELEITESLLLEDHRQVVEKLRRLAEAGVTIAIDDFGTGYSSLSYLHKFPISTLKIDRSFIRGLNSERMEACIVNAIVAMAQGLKLQVVAEGVEEEVQLRYLRSIQCPIVQGFLFGKPQPLSELLAGAMPAAVTHAG